jgi:beta-barrel assembly-enhancing protease
MHRSSHHHHRSRRAGGAKLRAAVALLCAALAAPPVWPQVRLPSLGESASDDVTVTTEKRLGEQIMREVRRDPAYLDDPVLQEYLLSVWQPLVAAARQHGDITPDIDANFAWEAFLVRDRGVNAFALPGGYVGVHLALIALTGSADELASVLAHELTHLTQRHIARSVTSSSRQSLLALAGMIVGLIAASRANSSDAAQAAIMGSQAAAVQGQLNFSRDMEREADRIGLTVLAQAGFAPAGMARMFERLDHANRLVDNGSYPYLRSHPLTTERVAEARARQGAGLGKLVRPEHALMQARSRVLMDPTVPARQRLQELDKASAASADERLGLLYASALASAVLRDFARANAAFAQGERQVADAALPARSTRVWAMLGVELALAQGDAPLAAKRMAALPDDASRARLLLESQVVLARNDAADVKRQSERLQTWVSERRGDALAWAALSSLAERQGQPLRAVRALAESHAANGDLGGAIDRLRAGQRLARAGGAPQDFIESSVIDARLRDLEGQRRRLMEELRGKSGQQRDPE